MTQVLFFQSKAYFHVTKTLALKAADLEGMQKRRKAALLEMKERGFALKKTLKNYTTGRH